MHIVSDTNANHTGSLEPDSARRKNLFGPNKASLIAAGAALGTRLVPAATIGDGNSRSAGQNVSIHARAHLRSTLGFHTDLRPADSVMTEILFSEVYKKPATQDLLLSQPK